MLDRSFARDMVQDSNGGKTVKAINSLGQALGREDIVEGVETESESFFLMRENCDAGNLFCKPLPGDVFTS